MNALVMSFDVPGGSWAAVDSVGCPGPPDTPPTPSRARKGLRPCSTPGKRARSPTPSQAETPPILVKDKDWQDGFRLISYQADDEGSRGLDMNYTVTLRARDPKGKAVKKTAVYTDHHPSRTPWSSRQEG